MGATAAALRLSARAVYLFAEPDVARRFYFPLGFEQIGSAWDCEKAPPGEKRELPVSPSRRDGTNNGGNKEG